MLGATVVVLVRAGGYRRKKLEGAGGEGAMHCRC